MSIRVKPRRATTFNAERSHTRQARHSKPPNKRPNKHLANITPFIMLSAIALLTGCYRPATRNSANEANHNAAVAHASADPTAAPTLPSMTTYTTTYTLEQARGKQAGGPPSSAQNTEESLSPGQYCFHKENADYWLSIRLALSNDNRQIKGESAGTIITHPEQDTTHYKQSFNGTLTGNQALVNVTTNIDGFTQRRQEAWAIDRSSLDMGRVSIATTPCLEISRNFQWP